MTRLLILPVKFAPLAFSFSFSFAVSFAFFASLPFFASSFGATAAAGWVALTAVDPDAAADTARECAVAVSSSLSTPLVGVVARDVASDPALGVPVFESFTVSADTSALSRMRSAWSNTSEVRIDSVRTREPVERKM